MKKIIILLSLIIFCFTTNAQNKVGGKFFIGIIKTPQNTGVNFIDFDVSDYLRFPPPDDARAHIPLGEKDLSSPNWGLNLGVIAPINKQFDFLLDFQFSFGNSYNGLFLFGSTFNVVNNNYFTFGPTAKIGFAYTKIYLGKVSVDNANAVVTAEGDFYDGDNMSASVFGFAYQVGFTGTCKLNKKLSLFGQFGLGGAIMGLMSIEVTPYEGPEFNINLSSKDCVEEGKYNYIGFTPKVKSYGPLIFNAENCLLFRKNRFLVLANRFLIFVHMILVEVNVIHAGTNVIHVGVNVIHAGVNVI
jgi:hypothetical protein